MAWGKVKQFFRYLVPVIPGRRDLWREQQARREQAQERDPNAWESWEFAAMRFKPGDENVRSHP